MKMKNLMGAFLALAGLAFGGSAFADGANGDIIKIFPCDERGQAVATPVSTSVTPLPGGETVRFVLRLTKRGITDPGWRLHYTGTGVEAIDMIRYPYQLGIFVSGSLRYANLEDYVQQDTYTDFIFSYVTKPGDFAMPIVLAVGQDDPQPANDDAFTDIAYHVNPLSIAGTPPRWTIDNSVAAKDGQPFQPATATANLWFNSASSVAAEADYDLRTAGFYVKTVGFDDAWEVAGTTWRSVHQDSSITGGTTPTLQVLGMPTNASTVYVWSKNESAVRIADIGQPELVTVSQRTVHITKGTTATRWVAAIRIVAGRTEYPFEIYGLSSGGEDDLILSAYPDIHYKNSTSEPYDDEYVTVKVRCTDPMPLSITLAPAKPLIMATSAYDHYQTELQVKLTQPYDRDLTLKITPSFENGSDAAWGEYIRFSDQQDVSALPAAVPPEVTIRAGSLTPESKLYVFALRSDENTVGVANHILFTPTTDDAQAQADIQNWGVATGGINIEAQLPEIVEPAEGDSSLTAVAGSPRTLNIKVVDAYADMTSMAGYEIWIRPDSDTVTTFSKLDGTYGIGKGGCLYKIAAGALTDELPSVVYSNTEAPNKSILYVKSPVSGNESEMRNFTVTVSAPAGFTVNAVDDAGEIIKNPQYLEGDDVTVSVVFDKQNTSGASLYAFLVPVTPKDRKAVDCSFLAENGGFGLEIPQYGRGCEGFFKMIDGCTGAANSQFRYKIELRTAAVYEDGETVESYMCKNTLALKSTNVIPKVDTVSMGLNETDDTGHFPGVVVAKNTTQTFVANITEPGLADLLATGAEAFKAKWIFSTTGVSNKGPIGHDDGIIEGDPADNPAEFKFTKAGTWTVKLQLRDKDMATWGDGVEKATYTFYVEVVDQPTITVTGLSSGMYERTTFSESDSLDFGGESYVKVNLAMNPCDFPLNVRLTVAAGDASATNPGRFVLQTGSEVAEVSAGVYDITFPSGITEIVIPVKDLDGTAMSKGQGFIFTPKVTTHEIVPDSGDQYADEYYLGVAKALKVTNDAPFVDERADLYPAPGTTNACAMGAGDPISWNFTDVLGDFEGGITVTVKGGGGHTETVTTAAQAAGSFTPNFTSSGLQTVQLTIKDKDNGQVSFIWYYDVEVAKTLTLMPHGPTDGNGTANSKRYRTAAGLGAGRVWAEGLSKISKFESSFNCSKATFWQVYGYGYKVGEIDDGVNLNKYADRDTPINADGNALGTGESGYAYKPAKDARGNEVDSFLYAWLRIASGDEGGALTDEIFGSATQAEYAESVNNGTKVGLPKEQTKDGNYEVTMLEAVFSREYLATDNMGDINRDGIPDIYVDKYGFGVVNTVSGQMSGDSDDLKAITVENNGNTDEDYLPTTGHSAYSTLIPGLPESWSDGTPFTAKTEIRGYGESLNDAPLKPWIGISGVKPERRYTDPRVDPRSTLDGLDPNGSGEPVEYYAWLAFAARNGIADPTNEANKASWELWSPECPSDPMEPDTDDDGYTDGYEYFFWYRAHVGYIENGVHRYLTGRAYDPKNPGEGKFISSEEIEKLMNPGEAYGEASSAKLRDTDNDGLPDLLEFEIGTNPFDFDTDGDGLPDGFEIMLGGTDPLLAETTPGISDAMRNFDGDAMAFTTPRLEAEGFVEPIPLVINSFLSFALVDPEGDTDGLQWYVSQKALDPENVVASAETKTGISFALQGDTNVLYVTSLPVLPVVDGRLACDLLKSQVRTMVATNDDFGVEGELNVALMPTLIPAGTPVTNVTEGVEYRTLAFEKDVKGVNAAWVYGRNMTLLTKGENLANMGGFGMLTIGRYQDAPAGVELAALPTQDDDVAYLHHFVYQEFGFDPRTAWNANTPLAPRWGTTFTVDDGEEGADTKESTEVIANNFLANYHYAGISVRTREYTLYDEFLVMSFFLNNGKLSTADVTPTQAMPWEKIWSKFTTNGQGPKEPNWEQDNEHFKGRTAETASGENGADTDRDGVPDGWELYVMAGPKIADEETKELLYNLVAPYNDGFYSSFGPFVGDAKSKSMTDNNATGGRSSTGGDGDGLTEWQEYAGTDSCDYYSGKNQGAEGEEYAYSETIVRPPEHEAWLNKFFPTDPWNSDTDGDGLTDANEAGAFKYGKPVDDYKHCCFAGGGLNPLSVDTDRDGLPDPWEKAFAGHAIYTGSDAQKPKDRDGNTVEDGNPLQGLCDGMDGTVFDAYNSPHINTMRISGDTMEAEELIVSLDGVAQVVDRDYDHDGLDNWQEYMTAAIRCWRYDDPVTGWDFTPDSAYFNPMTGEFDLGAAMAYTGISDPNEFWYRTLFDRSSKWYNPHFVTGTSPCSQYFSRVTNGWDQVFTETGTYYMFPDRNNDALFADIWANAYYGMSATPSGYICTSPILADTDRDGLDDYYELFHGLNPLIGEPDVPKESAGNPYDLVYSTWNGFFTPDNPMGNNRWLGLMPGNGVWDFVVHPWLDGIISADPDGDDIRNQDESIMPMVAPSTVWHHTDPTPLWMTDSSYNGSLVRRFYRMPCALSKVPVPESIVFEGKEYFLRDCDGFAPDTMGYAIWPFCPDQWDVVLPGYDNWMYSFEENEGYDTDHDAGSDYEELQGKFRNKTDPQDADSPRRRQAMYFGGPENKSALQTMPFIREVYPRAAMTYQTDMQFLQYTVECWVRPESADDSTVIERTTFADPSHCADRKYVRRNFMIGIRNGKWYTAFDSNGTLAESTVEVQGATDAKVGAWTYVAATFDANRLTLFVNGKEDGYVISNLKPEYGSSAVVIYPAGEGTVTTNGGAGSSFEAIDGTMHTYRVDLERPEIAFLLGASFANAGTGDHLLLTNCKGWGSYKDFFKGYVDEVRVWDGARPADEIDADFSSRKRYTREDALANRSAFYKQWSTGRRRYTKDGNGRDLDVVPELRFHWAFDSIPGADNAASVAQAPHGFLENAKPWYSRPLGYEVPWWSRVTGAYGSAYEGERSWVPWIPNTVTHLPRFDQTTIDSAYWSENYAGDEPGTYKFARTAEPVSLWTPMVRNGTMADLQFQTTGRRFWLSYNTGTNGTSTLPEQFEFTARHLNHSGDDLLPLGGAFARYVDAMWDGQGASSMWEQTGEDWDNDGLPDWWQEYAEQNYREGVPEGEDITWDTMIWYEIGGVRTRISAGEAYQRDLAKGTYVDANGEVRVGPTAYAQTAKTDGMIPDWWKELMKIDGEPPLGDLDNDGLNNYVEYMASELLPFRLNLDPRMARSDTVTLDYFRRIGRLYLGEMLTDHDQMEDHWERSLGDESIASAALWDALKDGEEDGWTNFAENRYNGYTMSTLAQLVAHAMGDNEVLDAPIPSIRMKVRYNGDRPLASASEGGEKQDESGSVSVPPIVVRAFSKSAETGDYVMNPDAVWSVRPGETVEKEVYLGGWEDRVVRGTMAPGNIDIGTLDIKFAQVPQSDLYSWTDESGTHISGTYKEFKEALDKNPDIIQNIQNFEWLSLYAPMNEYTSSDRAVTVTRDALTQKGYIAVYGERVGTVDLTTGDFVFDMAAMNKLRVNYTYDGGKGPAAAWGYKEAIFKITYTAKVPSAQQKIVDISLAKADRGFLLGGDNSFEAFYDLDDNGEWNPGEPFGVVNGVDVGWASHDVEIELSDMSAVTPRVKLWGASGGEGGGTSSSSGGKEGETAGRAAATDSDRGVRVGTATFETGDDARFEIATAPAPKSRVRIVRYKVDKFPVYKVGVDAGVVLEKDFTQESRDFLHEGDFLADGDLDIDWKNLYTDVVDWQGAQMAACEVTNVTYLIVYNWDKSEYASDKDTNSQVKANATLVTRRFEKTRSVPTPCPERAVYNQSRPTFAWKIENEDKWASWFGTTYTAFKVRVKDESGKNLVYDSGIRRLPAKDTYGVYTWTAPLYVGEKVPGTGVTFSNLAKYQWEVAVYNAKFKTDTLMAMETQGNPFSKPETFRMNVTDIDASSSTLALRVCYAGPATKLAGRVRAEAFASPDFSGDPIAVSTLEDALSLSPSGTVANVRMIGLPAGNYFVRAYIDTNQNGVHDDWESWGYLNERDLASKPGIFNPVALEASVNPSVANVRKVLIEDCDTDGDWFPDVWEAEQNGDTFDRTKISPVKGDAELIGVNTNLDANLTKAMQGVSEALMALKSLNGVALVTGISPAGVVPTANGFMVKSEVKSETLTIVGLSVDAANGRVLLKVGAETTANVDPTVASFLNVTVRKGAAVTVKVEYAETPAGPWIELQGVGGTVTVDRAGADVEVKLNGELPSQGYFRAKIVEE